MATGRTTKSAPLRVLIVDDHPMWRHTLRKVLESDVTMTVVAEASDGTEAIAEAARTEPGLVIMDVHLPTLGGADTTREILARRPDTKVLVLSASDERAHVVAAVRAGASGYLLKTAGPADVLDAVQRVHRGELVFPPALMEVILGELRGDRVDEPLRVIVADSAALFREGLARVLDDAGFVVVTQARNARELLARVGDERPDVVVTDVPDGIKQAHPDVGVVVLSDDVDLDAAAALLAGGVAGVGYLLKDRVDDVDDLADAIRRVARGGSVVDPAVAERLVRSKQRTVLDELTERERAVLELMAEGRSNQAIAERLYLSAKAVEAHTRNLFMKLGLEPAPDDHRRVLAVITYLRSV